MVIKKEEMLETWVESRKGKKIGYFSYRHLSPYGATGFTTHIPNTSPEGVKNTYGDMGCNCIDDLEDLIKGIQGFIDEYKENYGAPNNE